MVPPGVVLRGACSLSRSPLVWCCVDVLRLQPKPKRWARPDYGEGLEEAEANMTQVSAALLRVLVHCH